jgi:hypothetical protein
MVMTVPRQNIALPSVLVNQSQAARLNRAQDVSPELARQVIHLSLPKTASGPSNVLQSSCNNVTYLILRELPPQSSTWMVLILTFSRAMTFSRTTIGFQDGQYSLILSLSFRFGHDRITWIGFAESGGPGCAS